MDEVEDFDKKFDYSNKPLLVFKLGGEKFRARSFLAPAFMEREENWTNYEAACEFIRRIIVPEDRETFTRILHDPDTLITWEHINAIGIWLVEKASGNPTVSPASSGNGRNRTKTGLKGQSQEMAKSGKL